MRYVLGFMYSKDQEDVLLIRKLTPEWQKGKINGVGGKMEDSENDPKITMARECLEETGISTEPIDWYSYAVMENPEWTCHVFNCFTDNIYNYQKVEAEEPLILKVKDIQSNNELLTNLKWLIPMGLDPEFYKTSIVYL